MCVTQIILFFSACKNVEDAAILLAIFNDDKDDKEWDREDSGKHLVRFTPGVMATCPVEGLSVKMLGCNPPSIWQS